MNLLAQVDEKTLPTYFPPARFVKISTFTNVLIPILLVGSAVVLLIILFRASFMIITAGGDPERVAAARTMFLYAFFGFIIIVLSFVIVKVLGFILGVDVFV